MIGIYNLSKYSNKYSKFDIHLLVLDIQASIIRQLALVQDEAGNVFAKRQVKQRIGTASFHSLFCTQYQYINSLLVVLYKILD